jgi:DNA-binding NarL/FixJ family response regulator
MPTIALADDHSLLRNGLAILVQSLGYDVAFEANDGNELIETVKKGNEPDLILMDINMPEMDGFSATQWFVQHLPHIKILALSMYDNETSIIRMLKAGARGYILKDCDPAELKKAIDSVLDTGFYYSDLVSGRLIHAINSNDKDGLTHLNDRETEFLKYACTELTYKEIAEKMYLSPRTIDGYRDALFEKLNLKTRVGLVMYAIRNGIVIVN